MNINTANLKVILAASTDTDNIKFSTVRITNTYTEALDGHILARVSLPEQLDPAVIPASCPTGNAEAIEPFNIPSEIAGKIKALPVKLMPEINDAIFVDVSESGEDSEKATMRTTNLENTVEYEINKVDCAYPDTDKVLTPPNAPCCLRIGLNIGFLERLINVAKAVSGKEGIIFLNGYEGEEQGLFLSSENDATKQTFSGVIMPVKEQPKLFE